MLGVALASVAAYGGCMPEFDGLRDEGALGGSPAGGIKADAGAPGAGGSSGSGRAGASTFGGAPPGGETGDAGVGAGGTGSAVAGSGGLLEAGTGGAMEGVAGGGAGGADSVTCESGLVTCAGSPECQTDLDVGNPEDETVTDCGACGVTCSLTNASGATCAGGTCQPTCAGSFANCNASTNNDGCETDTDSSPTSCGACGRACSKNGVQTRACTDALCTPECAPKYADCDADDGTTDDGCETYLDELDACGSTCSDGVACDADQVCNGGSCAAAQGLVVFTIPFTAASQRQRYATRFDTQPNLTDGSVTLRMYAPGVVGGTLELNLTGPPPMNTASSPKTIVPLSNLADGWIDVVVVAPRTFDATSTYQVTIEIIPGPEGPWSADAPTVVYVDSVRTSDGTHYTFDAAFAPMIPSQYQIVDGFKLEWIDALPE